MAARYITTDLQFEAPFDLRPLLEGLVENGLFSLSEPILRNGFWSAVVEATGRGAFDRDIEALITAVEGLEGELRLAWEQCRIHEFDLGYACDPGGPSIWTLIPHGTVRRILSAGGSIRVTIYEDSEPLPSDSPEWESVAGPTEPYHIATDLELDAPFDFAALDAELRRAGIHSDFRPGKLRARYSSSERNCGRPEESLIHYAEITESLNEEARELWNRCTWRRFDPGFQSVAGCPIARWKFGPMPLSRLVDVGADLVVTVYPPEAIPNPPSVAPRRIEY